MKRIDLNDHRLTAYALGELTGPDRSTVAALIERDPEALREVASIRQLAGQLTEELQAEPCPTLEMSERRAINQELSVRHEQQQAPSVWPGLLLRFASYAGALAMVAMMLVVAYEVVRHRDSGISTKLAEIDTSIANMKPVGGRPVERLEMKVKPQQAMKQTPPMNLPDPSELGEHSVPMPSVAWSSGPDGLSRLEPSLSSFSSAQHRGNNWWGEYSGYGSGYSAPYKEHGLAYQHGNTEAYSGVTDNSFIPVAQQPLSTFSIDVDTASYANVRRFLNQNTRPPKDAVRIEELVNYFTYNYTPPSPNGDVPFTAHIESATCPWKTDHRLVRIGLKGKVISQEKRPPSNLVFLIDVSGSMNHPNKLPLVQQCMRLLADQLTENDQVAMVVYAGNSGLVLPSTTGDQKDVIRQAINRLQAGGSTHGSAGIQLAYETAVANFIKGGVNRVILCTDGDFNVGITSQADLQRLIEEKAKSGVFLSVLGFGMGNLKDSTMETLADKGNGNYGYIDTLAEAKKLFVDQMTGTLITIAKDVKIQVEFNPATVHAYRLIGYENRLLAKEDFNDDTKDAGEIGAGHTVTALYEIVPAGVAIATPGVDPLKYQVPPEPAATTTGSSELLTLKLRYKQPDGDTSKLLEYPFTDGDASFAKASTDFQFASAVAMFGMILRDSPHKGGSTIGGVIEIAESSLGADREGYRKEFVALAQKVAQLMPSDPVNARR